MSSTIRLSGVCVHNLKGIDVEIPRNHLTVISGVSGSGKSSLAFDTLYAEGRRRYVECLSTYMQQFMERIARPDMESAEGIQPAVAIQRAVPVTRARSTVGSITEIHDHLRLLFARVGRMFCIGCFREVRDEPVRIVTDVGLARGGRGMVTFNSGAPRTAAARRKLLRELSGAGFARIMRDEKTVPIEDAVKGEGPVEVVVDRVVFENSRRARIAEAIETAYRFGEDRCSIRWEDGKVRRFSRRLHCADCDREYRSPTPKLFSPNSPLGACPECQGFGRSVLPDMRLIIPDAGLRLSEGPVDPWNKPAYRQCYDDLKDAGGRIGLDWDVPYGELPAEHRSLIEDGGHGFYGIRGFFDWLERKKYKLHVRVFLARYRGYFPCQACDGKKLNQEALAVRIAGSNIAEISALPVREIRRWVDDLPLATAEREIAAPLVKELGNRLAFLTEAGAGYLALDRPTRTLSGGEAQRIQLARSLGSGLVETLYVLDEPSVGLHPRDVDRLIGILKRLRDAGNTVVVVEHDPRVIRSADWLIDLGPGAGESGGRVIYQGPVNGVRHAGDSATGASLFGRKDTYRLKGRDRPGGEGWIELTGVSTHNLRQVDARFPRAALTVVTGVSGSGKSSLIHDTLHGALAAALAGRRLETGPYHSINGLKGLDGVEMVDQSPIGRTPRSNPVTYIKGFDGIRRKLAGTAEARSRNLKPGYFSFNVRGGRCDACDGAGSVLVEMHFLPDVLVPCASCGGSRYGPGALSVRYRGHNIAEILQLTVRQALREFDDVRDVAGGLAFLDEVGLGYLRLGQPAPSLSGGEAQRLKLAAHLQAGGKGKKVFLLDEPTTGLHLKDVEVLIDLLRLLVEGGHTIVVVEHHLDLISAADWVIDLGPGAGEEGGRIVAQGPVRDIARSGTATGKYIAATMGSSLEDEYSGYHPYRSES